MSAVIPVAWALRRRRVQIAFSADPSLAWNLKRLQKWHRAKVVFSDGMRLSPRWLQDYDGVHLLAPHYLEEARPLVRPERIDRFFVVPYFVDTQLFRPAPPELRSKVRARLGAVADTRVALTVGPVGTDSSKRLDHIAAELARTGDPRWLLLSVGGNEAGADAVRRRSLEALGDRVRFLGSLPREALPEIYQAADVYTLGALAEPFSIAILEALATGLPVIHHRYPVTEWITGDAGRAVDMTVDTAAAEAFQQFSLATEAGRTASAAALRLTAIRYTPEVVGRQLIRQFRNLLGQGSSG
jgi:glycosyltransferase involved in cell wall biosynthesis